MQELQQTARKKKKKRKKKIDFHYNYIPSSSNVPLDNFKCLVHSLFMSVYLHNSCVFVYMCVHARVQGIITDNNKLLVYKNSKHQIFAAHFDASINIHYLLLQS